MLEPVDRRRLIAAQPTLSSNNTSPGGVILTRWGHVQDWDARPGDTISRSKAANARFDAQRTRSCV